MKILWVYLTEYCYQYNRRQFFVSDSFWETVRNEVTTTNVLPFTNRKAMLNELFYTFNPTKLGGITLNF